MNKRNRILPKYLAGICCCLFFLAARDLHAQADEKTRKRQVAEGYRDAGRSSFEQERPYYIYQWKGPLTHRIRMIRQLDDTTGIVEIASSEELEQMNQIALLAPANDRWKFSPGFELAEQRDSREQEYILTANKLQDLLDILAKIRGVEILSVNRPSSSLVVRATARLIREELAALKEVIFIDIRSRARSEVSIIGYNRSFHGLSAVDYSLPGANGKNRVVGVKEQRMESADLDLYKRVLPSPLSGGAVTAHATVVASIIGGAGNSFYDGRGIAWGCSFFPSSFDNLFADDAAVLNASRVSVQNHSYGTVIQSFYGAEALSYDAQTWVNKQILHVFSAGNQGTAAGAGRYAGLPGFANITGNFKMAKNIITVGAIDNKGSVPAESSAGPLYDGRVAPQLIALGPNGTSDAAAVVSGTIAVLQQVYADSNSQQLPPATLVKALLYNNADELQNTGPDFKTGYGLLNSFESIKALRQKQFDGGTLLQGQQWVRSITVPPGSAQLKITLAWTDSNASVNNNKALINDLDMDVVAPGGTVYQPWVLSSAPQTDSLNKAATRRRDSLNTAEQVSILFPAAGSYQVRVSGTSVINTPLPFHIAVRVDTLQTFLFTSPQHTADVNRDENPVLDIRWRTFVPDTNQTGNLLISYDGGANWQPVRNAVKLHPGYFAWPVKDTISRAQLRMQTTFGDFYSREFVISPVVRPNIDFLCADSLGLSWKQHRYAGSYKIYGLADSPYLKPLFTVTDTFTVIRRNLFPYQVFAVEPQLTNGLPAARSIAFDINLQGAKCFYRTFYYVMQDRNELNLVLELSAPSYIDSVFFEEVTANGQWLRTAGKQKTNLSALYQELVKQIRTGTTYWRARIRLKNGATVYTEIISVLSSGQRHILFYPNPAARNTPLTWVLQQGTPASSGLQFYDAAGRLLASYAELPSVIDLRPLSPGLLIYKLTGPGNKLIEAGKLLVQ